MKILAGKRASRAKKPTSRQASDHKHAASDSAAISVFNTPLGWMGLLGIDDQLVTVFSGHSSTGSIKSAAKRSADKIEISDWNPAVRGLLEAYAAGENVDFSHVELELPPMTPFRHLIICATRQVAYGETTTYGELAARIGHPGAARAVGTVMSTNRFPIIIPCHRVLSAGGNIGGYTSPAGLELKRQMLLMEEQGHGTLPAGIHMKWTLAR